jgi:hypothetical protein
MHIYGVKYLLQLQTHPDTSIHAYDLKHDFSK